MTYVRYIDKTREYYRSQGYDKAYQWAHFEEVAFQPLPKPLSESRVALVSTGEVEVKGVNLSEDEKKLLLQWATVARLQYKNELIISSN